jgi:hypothetical protein
MTMRSIALFVHVLGMLALFVALAVEWVGVELLRAADQAEPSSFATSLLRQLPRFTGVALALILLSGVDLAVQFGLLRSAWVGVSFAAMVLMTGLGRVALRQLLGTLGSGANAIGMIGRQASSTFVRVSLRTRVGVALGIVYLMIAKPELLASVAIATMALVVGAINGVAASRSSPTAEPSGRQGS